MKRSKFSHPILVGGREIISEANMSRDINKALSRSWKSGEISFPGEHDFMMKVVRLHRAFRDWNKIGIVKVMAERVPFIGARFSLLLCDGTKIPIYRAELKNRLGDRGDLVDKALRKDYLWEHNSTWRFSECAWAWMGATQLELLDIVLDEKRNLGDPDQKASWNAFLKTWKEHQHGS
jgi:hypothetical protein